MAWGQAAPTANSRPQCYTLPPGTSSTGATSTTQPAGAAPAATTPARNVAGSSCGKFADFAPYFYQTNNLPALPIKTVRLIFHVMQKDDGTENWQSPAQDGGKDEAILRGYVGGTTWPAPGQPGSAYARGVNDVYRQLDQAQVVVPGTPWPTTSTPALPPFDDTRIRFELVAVRYYRDTNGWNMGGSGLFADLNMDYLHQRYVLNSALNPGINGAAVPNQQVALNAVDQATAIHVFWGENPGTAGTPTDQFGVPVSRYQAGGVAGALGSRLVSMRGFYWTLRNHPFWSPGGVANASGNQQSSFIYGIQVLSHEMGHCMGLYHPHEADGCTSVYADPASTGKGTSNNIMDSVVLPGLSLSQCQIGVMHDALSAGAATNSAYPGYVDEAQVRDHWTTLPSQDNVIGSSQTWSTVHNLRGNLYVNAGVTLTVKCRVGLLGSTTGVGAAAGTAKIVVRQGGRLIFDGATLGNYATSDRSEAPQTLRLLLGGDATDTDNRGLITLRGAGLRLQSSKVQAELSAGATLHLEGSADLTVDAAQLTTRPGSYLCAVAGATVRYANGGRLTVQPGTNLGVGPFVNLVLNPLPNCVSSTCLFYNNGITITGVGSAGNVVDAGSSVCPTTLTLTVNTGTANPAASGYTFQWTRDGGTSLGTGVSLTNTLPVNNGTNGLPVVYTCVVQPPGGCPAVTVTYTVRVVGGGFGTPVLLNANPTICVPATGLYNLAGLVPTVVSNPGAVSWASSPYLSFVDDGTGGYIYYFDARAARLQGTTHTISVFNFGPGVRCGSGATVTINLRDAPDIEPGRMLSAYCPGAKVVLSVPAQLGVSYVWQPGNLSGSTVQLAASTSTTYTVTATGAGGCTNRQTVRVNVLPATCPTCEPAVVQMNPVVNGGVVKAYRNGFLFKTGITYYFSTTTELTNGQYLAEPGSRLLFGPDVYLDIFNDGCLQLQGATLTATCNQQWGGIRLKNVYGVRAFNTGASINELSHSREGITFAPDWFWGPNSGTITTPCYALQLNGMRFLHNTRSLQVTRGAFAGLGAAMGRTVSIVNCTFDSDPAQMLAPAAYVSATNQQCAYAHLTMGGDVTYVTLTGNTFSRALFGIWAPDAQGLTARNNTFTDCYLAGAVNLLNTGPATWDNNKFEFAPPANDFVRLPNPFVATGYAALAALGSAVAPRIISAPGTSVGLAAAGEPLTVTGSRFRQLTPFSSYSSTEPYPQTGLWAGRGTVRLQGTEFLGLYQGGVQQAQQPGTGETKGNTFVNCRTGLFFRNAPGAGPAGRAVLTCNSFQQPTNVAVAECFGIYLGPGPFVAGQLGQQINISSTGSAAILQTNRFTGPLPTAGATPSFWHVYNDGGNARMDYRHYYFGTPGTRVPNDAVVVGDNTNGTSGVNLLYGSPIEYVGGVTCAAQNYPGGVGLRPATTSTLPSGAMRYYLAQNVPNPCSGSTSVSYRVPASAEKAELVIRDSFSGKTWQRTTLQNGERTIEIQVHMLLPGAYYYSLEIGGASVSHHQLLVQ